ncbi:MAG: hypothetical protein SWH54_03725, partial [Thermodesulfobacteriota bacterium]|nr:hypothetical protein [Thermodesulfobacteriota bacterium]
WILVTESALLPLIQKEHFLNTQHSFCHSPQLSWGFSSVINYLQKPSILGKIQQSRIHAYLPRNTMP